MDIEQRKTYVPLNKIRLRNRKSTLWLGSTLVFMALSLTAHFFLKDENLRIFGSLTYKEVLRKFALGGVFISAILFLMKWSERLILRESKSSSTSYNLIRVLRLICALLIIMVIISIVFVNWYAAAVSFGVISLIFSFALQMPLSSLIAWTYILVRAPYHVGDRIKIGGFKGDVVEINYMDTTLWEIGGDYLDNDLPSGKLVRFPNSMVLQNAVYNYSWERFPYIWNQLTVFVAYGSDLDVVGKVMKDVAAKEFGADFIKDIENYKSLAKSTTVEESDLSETPLISFNIKTDTWVQASLTYIVDPKKTTEVRSRMLKHILVELKKVAVVK